jgi:hypothetical protein
VQPIEHPSIRKAVARIYKVSPLALDSCLSYTPPLIFIMVPTITSPSPSLQHYISADLADLQDRGISGFFSGSSLRISRKAASSAIAWTVYEALLMFLRDQHLDTNSNTAIPA